eukprot:CAMPEP_0198214984 /NCGR_PEP_ID=MMETSP1445-20131203/46021_1 /TAXON_ID=36898 /ORGANISM="Pyramimonas sp., Strain CCMP2087" /LENGTH=174 /DNA_ID=CAMNT_0043890463 /DNA_START=135 /DNA_END=655 /DNA_ORIENTATION=-
MSWTASANLVGFKNTQQEHTRQIPRAFLSGAHHGRDGTYKGCVNKAAHSAKLAAYTQSSLSRGLRQLQVPLVVRGRMCRTRFAQRLTISMGKKSDRRKRQKGMLLKKGSNKLSLENGFLLLAAGLGVAVLGSFAAVALPGMVMAVVILASVSIFLGSVILPFTVISGAVVASSL